MKHKIDIWKKNKVSGYTTIEAHLVLTEDDIENAALNKHIDSHNIDDECEYWARIDETII